MMQGLLSGVLGGLKGNREAQTGEGFQDLGTGFMTWNPGDPSKKLEGTVGGFVEGFIGGAGGGGGGGSSSGGLMGSLLGGGGAGGDAAGAGLMQKLAGDKEQEKSNKQMAGLMDKSADMLKEFEIVPQDANIDDFSVNQKAEFGRQLFGKMKLMNQAEQARPQQAWQPTDAATPSGRTGIMTSPNSFRPDETATQQIHPEIGPQGAVVRSGNAIGTWDARRGQYGGWKIPSAGQVIRDAGGNVIFQQGGTNVEGIPEYQGQAPAVEGARAQVAGRPPVAGARQADDGKWYVEDNGQFFEVQ